MKITKKHCEIAHAQRRFNQRFGKPLTRARRLEITSMIQEGRATLICEQSIRVKHYRIVYEGKVMDVVYDRQRKCIVTFLFPRGENGLQRRGSGNHR